MTALACAFRRIWYIVVVSLALVAAAVVYYFHRVPQPAAIPGEHSAIDVRREPNGIDIRGPGVLTLERAQALALERTGLGKLGTMRKPVLIEAQNLHIPFIGKKFEGKQAWEVTFDDVRLKLPSQGDEHKEKYTRIFRVLLDAHTGQVLLITSRLAGTSQNSYEQPPDWYAENDMRGDGEVCEGLPDSVPRVTFLDALEAILRDGYADPCLAKEIYAVCVIQVKPGIQGLVSRPIWAITLNDIPPMRFHASENEPDSESNHVRIWVHTQYGDAFMGSNTPQAAPTRGWKSIEEKEGRGRKELGEMEGPWSRK